MERELSEPSDEGPVEGIPVPTSADAIVKSEAPPGAAPASDIGDLLREMDEIYRADPMLAVRGQAFIKLLHGFVADQLDARLTRFSRRRGIKVVKEATILGSTKPKDEDVAVIDPENGPLVLVGVRSQMSSVGKNALNYYEMLVGECTSLQEWFPMTTHGYVYLHPLQSIKIGKEDETIDHTRYARMYAAATGRDKRDYKTQRGRFDHFAYMVVDFDKSPPLVRDDIVKASVPDLDMSIDTFVDRLIGTFKERLILWDVFD
jgi:hypothetical protein